MAEKVIQIADKPTLDEVKALLENSGYGLEAIKDAIGSGGSSGGGGIKSVQYGTGRNSTKTTKIEHNQVNVDKSFIIVDWSAGSGSYDSDGFYISSKTSTYFALSRYVSSGNGADFSWQLIEFE